MAQANPNCSSSPILSAEGAISLVLMLLLTSFRCRLCAAARNYLVLLRCRNAFHRSGVRFRLMTATRMCRSALFPCSKTLRYKRSVASTVRSQLKRSSTLRFIAIGRDADVLPCSAAKTAFLMLAASPGSAYQASLPDIQAHVQMCSLPVECRSVQLPGSPGHRFPSSSAVCELPLLHRPTQVGSAVCDQ